MATKQNTAIADAIASAPTWAALASVLNVPGKRLRDVARGVFGIYKSRDADGYNVRSRAFVTAYLLAPAGDTRKGITEAWKTGDELPPVK